MAQQPKHQHPEPAPDRRLQDWRGGGQKGHDSVALPARGVMPEGHGAEAVERQRHPFDHGC